MTELQNIIRLHTKLRNFLSKNGLNGMLYSLEK